MGSYFSDVFEMLEFCGMLLLAFLLGCITSIAVIAYLFHKYLDFSSILYKKSLPSYKKVQFGDLLQNNMSFSSKSVDLVESCRFLNVLLAFIFKEWRDTATVYRWIVKKINVEVSELMETKAAKRLLHAIRIHHFNLGENSPVIHGISIKEPCAFTADHLFDRVVLDVEVEYSGGFQLSVDVDLLFGKSAFVSIRVKHLKGQVRLQFSRKPCTHWSVSFVGEPVLDVKIDTNFFSRPLPQLGSLILNQVQRTIRRKHTFPNYKIRYTPFNAFWMDYFKEVGIDDATTHCSKIDVTITSCSRLLLPHKLEGGKEGSPCRTVFATLALNQLSCEGAKLEQNETKKNNFLLTSIADVLSEVEGFNIQYPELPADMEEPVSSGAPVTGSDESSNEKMVDIQPKVEEEKCVPSQDEEPSENAPHPGTSYMMVTRNFSAVLSEEMSGGSNSQPRVHVGSIVWNKTAKMKPSISEGDRILSINGHEIETLGQAIAVINNIRAQKTRFYFKVQRKRARSRGASAGRDKRIGGSFRSRGSSNPFPHPPSSDSASSVDETESDFTDLDTDEHDSYISEEQDRHSRVLRPSNSTTSGHKAESSDNVTNTPSSSSANLRLPNSDAAPPSDARQTSLCDADQSEYAWPNEQFSLAVDESHRYLNLRFWFEEVHTTSSKKGNLTLVGVVAVPLPCIQQLCSLVTSSTVALRFKVTSPYSAESELRRTAERVFKQKTCFKLDHCYGDVTLTIGIQR